MKKKLSKPRERKTTMVSLRMPEDVVEDLKRVAPLKGMTGYQAIAERFENCGKRRER